MEDAEEVPAFPTSSPPRSPLTPSPPAAVLTAGHAEGRRAGGPILPTYQARISLGSNPTPAHSPVLKTRIGSSLSFNRGTVHPPRANGTNLTRVSSFQTRLKPNGFSSSLGLGGSDNESLHSSSSSLECPTPAQGLPNAARQSESTRVGASQLASPALKKFSSHGNVFHAEADRPVRQAAKAALNHGSLPSLDLHIAEDGPPPGADPTAVRRSDQNCLLLPLKSRIFVGKEAPAPPLEISQLVNLTPPAPASRQTMKLQKFPISLDGLVEKPPEGAILAPGPNSGPTAAKLNLSPNQKPSEIAREERPVVVGDVSVLPSSGRLLGLANREGSASPPEAVAFHLVSQPQLTPAPSQPSFLGCPEMAPSQGTPAAPSLNKHSSATAEKISSVSSPEASKIQTPAPASCPREDPLPKASQTPRASCEKMDQVQGKGMMKEEQSPEAQRISMEEQPTRGQVPQDAPSLSTGDRELFGYVGIEAVLDQMRIKTMKMGFEFNIMVVGQSGLGKSTMVNTLFKSKVSRKSACPGYEECIPKTLHLLSVSHVVEEKGVKMKLTVTDTPGFGDQINNQNCWEPIITYINDQYERYLREEILINRKRKIPDTRVHACVYFVPPTGHWLRPLDLEFMRRLSKITNVVPVIAKADTLTLEERAEFKQRIQKDLKAHGIHVYPQEAFDDDPDDRLLNNKIREKIPFAVVGADKEHQANGKKVLGRKTKWGIIEVENPAHCEFPLLRDLLIRSHLQDLKDITHSIHYEQYRMRRLSESNLGAKGGERLALNSINGEPESHL
ncbi:septin-12 isoform X2 [Hemicordylus capensis]|nr:septin-12 isoform X2 [Hemicordylus capensis]